MNADQNARPSPSGYQRQRLSLTRCRACGRAEELSSADIMGRMREGGAVCCGQVMDLYVPAAWPGVTVPRHVPMENKMAIRPLNQRYEFNLSSDPAAVTRGS